MLTRKGRPARRPLAAIARTRRLALCRRPRSHRHAPCARPLQNHASQRHSTPIRAGQPTLPSAITSICTAGPTSRPHPCHPPWRGTSVRRPIGRSLGRKRGPFIDYSETARVLFHEALRHLKLPLPPQICVSYPQSPNLHSARPLDVETAHSRGRPSYVLLSLLTHLIRSPAFFPSLCASAFIIPAWQDLHQRLPAVFHICTACYI